ncbi:MAG: tRNA glutamyl-Q(34) synthetase GluQRS [Desulfovibrio sp.]|jgi:glutamyl-tRNA synthetase|nr:tRNA glutamyl-Q(34) synthetase GluQRS [Desulfovibrio sp.]
MDARGGIRGRFAPSPTGGLHVGHAYIFLMAWLSVRSRGGTPVLRMEDIDPARCRPEFAEGIVRDLAWLGLDYDEGPGRGGPYAPYAQSLRTARYTGILEALEARGLLYPCWCSRKELRNLAGAPHADERSAPYPGACRTLSREQRAEKERAGRKSCLRLDVRAALRELAAGRSLNAQAGSRSEAGKDASPAAGTAGLYVADLFAGELKIDEDACGGDFALRRSDGVFSYQLAVAADDADMAISEVVRGEDLLSSTPRQALLFFLLGKTPPLYIHLPLLLDAQGERPAKRHKSLELAALRGAGVCPRVLVGGIAHLCGLLDRPRPVAPRELLPGFGLAGLKGRRLRLPEPFAGFATGR